MEAASLPRRANTLFSVSIMSAVSLSAAFKYSGNRLKDMAS
jgi:hypothetical protein